jgi:hypothetical protein
MMIRVVVEPIENDGYRAKGEEPYAITAEGASREESVRKLRELLESRLGNRTPLELVEVNPSHPWAKFAGTLRDDPLADAWEEAMRQYRRTKDEEPDIP